MIRAPRRQSRSVEMPTHLRARLPEPTYLWFMFRRLLVPVLSLTTLSANSLAAQDTVTAASGLVRSRTGTSLALSGLFQTDLRLIASDPAASGPIIRRAELIFEASAPRGFSLRLQPDFGLGRVLIQDAFIRWSGPVADSLVARVGRFRPAFGSERLRSSSALLFPERGLVNSYMPGRASGVDLRITRASTALQLGVFQPPVSASAQVLDTDGDLERTPPPRQAVLLRLEWRPHRLAGSGNLRVHAGALAGRASGRGEAATQPARILTIGQRPVFAFRASGTDPVIADGSYWRGDVGVESIGSRVAWQVEVLKVEDGISRQGTAHDAVKHTGYGAAWSAVYGGRRTRSYAIIPASRWGAVEWGLRVGMVQVGPGAVTRYAEPGSVAHARSVGGAIAWLPSAVTRLAASYDMTRLSGPRHLVEHAVIVRVQQTF